MGISFVLEALSRHEIKTFISAHIRHVEHVCMLCLLSISTNLDLFKISHCGAHTNSQVQILCFAIILEMFPINVRRK